MPPEAQTLLHSQLPWSFKYINVRGAAIAQWIRLRLPSCCPGFKSQACYLCIFIYNICAILSFEKNKNKQKEAGFGPFFKKVYKCFQNYPLLQDSLIKCALKSFRLFDDSHQTQPFKSVLWFIGTFSIKNIWMDLSLRRRPTSNQLFC